jgi:hypothetical protein
MTYYLTINTDGDFGLNIGGRKFYKQVNIKSSSFKKLQKLVQKIQVFETNPQKTEVGNELINILQKQIKDSTSGTLGGNWSFEFGELKNPKWDIVL